MALLDSVTLFSNQSFIVEWANGKFGAIIPTENSSYIFEEYEIIDGISYPKYQKEDWAEKCPTLAFGFVFFWLRNRIRNSKREERLVTLFAPDHKGIIPKEIYDNYIEARKTWFIDMMNRRPDSWRYPDLEKEFYTNNLTIDYESELIKNSNTLLEYLDEEDKAEFHDICDNFLSYMIHVVEPYQHNIAKAVEAKRREREEEDYRRNDAWCKKATQELEEEWPRPQKIDDDTKYDIDSPVILELAKGLTNLQILFLQQLVENNNEIKYWEENKVLNQYSKQEIWDAAYPLDTNDLICGFVQYGSVECIQIRDKGKLVLRCAISNYNSDKVIFNRKDRQGEIIQKTITAREICDIIRSKKKLNVMQKKEWSELLSEITGLAPRSFEALL